MKPIIPKTSGNGVLLELLVEFFHRSILTETTKITRRKIYRRNGRVFAEIDVLLEDGDVRVAIECRDRSKKHSKKQGLPWIQQVIGKREVLRSYGIIIPHWFVVSASGFTEDAIDVARTTGIELLVPGEVTPVEPDAPGLHQLMRSSAVRLAWWDHVEVDTEIGHSDDTVLNQVQRDLAKDNAWFNTQVGQTSGDLRPFSQFIEDTVRPLIKVEEQASGGTDYSKTIKLTFKKLYGSVSSIAFEIESLVLKIVIQSTTIQPEFRTLTFVSPITRRVLGVVGLNTFERDGNRMHIMMYIKSGHPPRLIGSIKDDRGNPVPNVAISFPASLVTPPNTETSSS